MKKVLKVITICLLTAFSFYYTDKVIDLSRKNDPIMEEIKNSKEKNNIDPVNAVIEENTIRVGQSGKKIDEEASYEKMKKIDSYSENLLEYISIKPSITKDDNYEKLITGVNTNNKEISIVFTTDNIDYIKQIAHILNKNNIQGTFFIDGKIIEQNLLEIKKLFEHNISLGIYKYNNAFNITSIKYMKNLLEKQLNTENYCLYKDNNFLKNCTYSKINTIKPEQIQNNLYIYIKNNKTNGTIYEIKVNKNNIKQLNSTIIYLTQKGYQIKSLNDLLKE